MKAQIAAIALAGLALSGCIESIGWKVNPDGTTDVTTRVGTSQPTEGTLWKATEPSK